MWLSYAVWFFFFIFTVVQDRVIAYWFPDKLGLAFGAIVSVIRCGNVLNFFITSNIAKIYGVPMALWTGKQKYIFNFILILHYIIKVWREHFFNHLAGALMCGVGCVAALGYCVLDMIGSRKLDKNHVFNIKSQPLVRDELKYFIDINVIFIHNRFQRNTRIDSLQSVFSNKKWREQITL